MKKICEEIKKMFSSSKAFKILFSIGVVVVILIVFSAGVSVGFHKASFGRTWGENYERNFGRGISQNRMPAFGREHGDDFPNSHGAIGKIIKIELPTLILQGKDGLEKSVIIGDDTQIQKMRDNITKEKLEINDFVVIIGSPNTTGQIEARLIRIIPSPELMPILNK